MLTKVSPTKATRNTAGGAGGGGGGGSGGVTLTNSRLALLLTELVESRPCPMPSSVTDEGTNAYRLKAMATFRKRRASTHTDVTYSVSGGTPS
jgi:hypothetical protein